MKKLLGTPYNINKTIIAKVTSSPVNLFKRSNYVLITDRISNNGYAAVIIRNESFREFIKTPTLIGVKNLEQLKDGDVIAIEADGTITVLYETGSSHNILFLTGRCNCSCIMCPQPPISYDGDRTTLNLQLISLMDTNTPSLGLTGGEPTLLGDKLIEIMLTCKRRLPKTHLALLSNGIRFENYEFAKKIFMIKHPNLIIEIPLHSDTDTENDKIMGMKGFYKIVRGLYNLALFKQKIGIRIVINKLNYNRLIQLAEFIYRNFPFVFHVIFMQMEITGYAKENINELWIDPYNYGEQLEKAIIYLVQRDLNVSIYNSQLCILPESIWQYSRKSISPWKNIYLERCNECNYHEKCGGLFDSSVELFSSHLRPLA